jgi:antitoxin CptB
MKLTQRSGPPAEAATHSDATIVPGRLRWRCRRGLKELDVLMEASGAECRVFGELLELPDPVLAGYLLGGETPAEPHLAQGIARMRALCRLDGGSAVF